MACTQQPNSNNILFNVPWVLLQQEQFGVGTDSSNHSARQWEVYSAVGHHQVCVPCSIGKLFIGLYERSQHSLKLNCQLKVFKVNQLLLPLCSFLAGCVSARQHHSLFLRRTQPHSSLLQFLPASGKNSLVFNFLLCETKHFLWRWWPNVSNGFCSWWVSCPSCPSSSLSCGCCSMPSERPGSSPSSAAHRQLVW